MRPALIDNDGNLLEVLRIRFDVFPERLDEPACRLPMYQHPLYVWNPIVTNPQRHPAPISPAQYTLLPSP